MAFLTNDDKIALISAICGITYTLFAGKGKVYCFYAGILGTFCYCIICAKNGLWGNLGLYALYFLPMEILGIFNWKKNLDKNKNEIIKTKLTPKERIICFLCSSIITFIIYLIIKANSGSYPLFDSFVTGFSILGQYLTLKRCIEQWIVWFFVNLSAVVMWFFVYFETSNYGATLFMWVVYLILAVYFYIKWKKEENLAIK